MKVTCNFNLLEYGEVEQKAKELGFTVSGFVEYAALLLTDIPRTTQTNVIYLQNTIDNYIQNFKGGTFICSTPFDKEWSTFTTSAKRTVAAILKKKEQAGIIKKVPATSKHHSITHYTV